MKSKITLSDRTIAINEENYNGLSSLYGELSIDRLTEIVNKHISVAILEINEDLEEANL